MSELDGIGRQLPSIARTAIASWVLGRECQPESKPGAPRMPVFVTLRDSQGALRGCVGSVNAVETDVIAETARSAVLAASRDPRFEPVRAEELSDLSIEVSVLLPEEPISGLDELDPSNYGVIVRDDCGRRGLLLPNVPGISTAANQVEVARRKAGLSTDESARLSRFRVLKFQEDGELEQELCGRSRD